MILYTMMDFVPVWVTLHIELGVAALVISCFCWISFAKSMLVVAIYFIAHLAISVATLLAMPALGDPRAMLELLQPY